jgi:dipeptidyl aminopeptidase/acylaminoacyl peptidase
VIHGVMARAKNFQFMKRAKSKRDSVKWYQLSPSEFLNLVLNSGLQFALSVLSAVGRGLAVCRKRPGASALTIIIPLLVIACQRAGRGRPAHLTETLAELSAIKIPTGRPVPNHAGTKLVYIKFNTNDSWGVYLHDLVTGKTRMETEFGSGKAQEAITEASTRLLGWSADDQFFAYGTIRSGDINICDGKTGSHLGRFTLKRRLVAWTWTSQNRFLYSDGVSIFEAAPGQPKWVASAYYQVPQNPHGTNAANGGVTEITTGISRLVAGWGNSAVWLQANTLYLGAKGRAPQKIWQTTNSTLLDFSFYIEARKFLLHGRDAAGEFLVDYFPDALGGRDRLTNMVRLDTREYHPKDVTLINHGEGYAYLNQSDFSRNKLTVKLTHDSPPVQLPWGSEVRDFFINDLQLYAVSSSTNEPAGIWRYDLVSGKLDELVSSLDHPLQYAANALVVEGYVTNAAGERLTYYLLHPTGPPDQQKHPLVVCISGMGGFKGYNWDRYAQAVANCGACLVCTDRRQREPSQWAEDAFCVYESLAKTPEIDTNRVYLMGISYGNVCVNELLASRPEFWRGAVYYGTTRFPNPERLQVKSLLLDLGAEEVKEGNSYAQLLTSQDAVAAAGIQPMLVMHPGVGHNIRRISLERERLKQLVAFISQP